MKNELAIFKTQFTWCFGQKISLQNHLINWKESNQWRKCTDNYYKSVWQTNYKWMTDSNTRKDRPTVHDTTESRNDEKMHTDRQPVNQWQTDKKDRTDQHSMSQQTDQLTYTSIDEEKTDKWHSYKCFTIVIYDCNMTMACTINYDHNKLSLGCDTKLWSRGNHLWS